MTTRDLPGGHEGPRAPPSECPPHAGAQQSSDNLEFISIRSFSSGGSPWLLSYQLDMAVALGQRASKGQITASTCSSSHSGHLIYLGNFSVGDHFCESAGSKKNTKVCQGCLNFKIKIGITFWGPIETMGFNILMLY